VAEGTPEQVAQVESSATAASLGRHTLLPPAPRGSACGGDGGGGLAQDLTGLPCLPSGSCALTGSVV
jgi:hypothetical protein